MKEAQQELKFFESKPEDCEWLITLLKGRDWTTANEILKEIGTEASESGRRKLRSIAAASDGRIAGGQFGYKLVKTMTRDEYDHFRNWMTTQAAEMQRRVCQSDRVFFARKPVP